MANGEIHVEVRRQVAALQLMPERPLILCDADEVLLRFVEALERFLEERDLRLDLTSFALTGNIKNRRSGQALPPAQVRDLLADFYEHRTGTIAPVAGAAESLAALARQAQVVVVSNVPLHRLAARRRNLRRHGMDYPVIANVGSKGGAVRLMAEAVDAPTFFLDDIPRNLASVAAEATEVVRLHFVADPRLARLVPPAEHCHVRIDTWPEARAYIEARLNGADASRGAGCD